MPIYAEKGRHGLEIHPPRRYNPNASVEATTIFPPSENVPPENVHMRKLNNDEITPAARTRRGRAVLVGYGLDDADGHVRITRGRAFELYGGSESAHGEMQRRAEIIQAEANRLGISLDRMTYEQYQVMRGVVERVNGE